ncbi:MAG: DapH/DapD/GlmU-related protein [Ignavibacteria bacterium]
MKIGNNVVLWSGNHIGHDVEIDDHNFITSHAVVSGFVKIRNNCFIGVNATIRDGITIAPETLIAAGAIIMKDTVEKVFTFRHVQLCLIKRAMRYRSPDR